MRISLAPKVLIVDEFGVWTYDQDAFSPPMIVGRVNQSGRARPVPDGPVASSVLNV